jgi:uncharacterized membrane protein YgaE (UPF0421/DUF939 family)
MKTKPTTQIIDEIIKKIKSGFCAKVIAASIGIAQKTYYKLLEQGSKVEKLLELGQKIQK